MARGLPWNVSTFNYDALNRLTSAEDPMEGAWTATYHDESGHRTAVTYNLLSADDESWTYDKAGRLVAHTWNMNYLGESGNVSWTLDGEGRTAFPPNKSTLAV